MPTPYEISMPKRKLKGRSDLNEAVQRVLEAPTKKTKPCPHCGYKEEEVKPRRIAILENLAEVACDPLHKQTVQAANALFDHGYEQKEIDPIAALRLLIEHSDMPAQWRESLLAGINDDSEMTLEKPLQVIEWQTDLNLTSDDFPVQLQKGEEMLVIRNQNEWDIFMKARTW